MKNIATALLVLFAFAPLAQAKEVKDTSISGNLTLSAELQKKVQPTAILFLIAKKAGAGGPPLAVKRIAQPFKFPVAFSISGADAMMPGIAFEGPLALTARISQSGSAMPVSPGDIEGKAKGELAVGAKNVEISLDQVK